MSKSLLNSLGDSIACPLQLLRRATLTSTCPRTSSLRLPDVINFCRFALRDHVGYPQSLVKLKVVHYLSNRRQVKPNT